MSGKVRQLVPAFLLLCSLQIVPVLHAAPNQDDGPGDVRARVVRVLKQLRHLILGSLDDSSEISIPKP